MTDIELKECGNSSYPNSTVFVPSVSTLNTFEPLSHRRQWIKVKQPIFVYVYFVKCT